MSGDLVILILRCATSTSSILPALQVPFCYKEYKAGALTGGKYSHTALHGFPPERQRGHNGSVVHAHNTQVLIVIAGMLIMQA